jgi:hypothetical protein
MARAKTQRSRFTVTLAMLFALLSAAVSHADRREWRLSPVGTLGATNVDALDHPGGWSLALGGGIRIAHGVINFLELGATSQFLTVPTLTLTNVSVGNQTGTLVTTYYSVDTTLDLRLIGDVHLTRAFARFRPFVGARLGFLVRILDQAELLDAMTAHLVMRLEDDVHLLPLVAGYVGGEVRFARAWQLGLVGEFRYSDFGNYSVIGGLEISWLTY